ncbi:MAG TPA: hypothetical protein VFM72_04080 [Aequorivita sp.]|nr:hypothetical protein [Aequorivita sp.]
MSRNRTIYLGEFNESVSKKIFLNINKLEDGQYVLTIVNNKKIIKEVTFIKTTNN